MHLTRFTDLGLRVLMYLAVQDRQPPVTIAEIASQFDVPQNHLIKVVHRLGQLGWVATQRGRRGGLRLGVEASALPIGDVLRALEGDPSLVDCSSPPCALQGRCRLKSVLDQALAGFYTQLNEYTLAQVCQQRTEQTLLRLHRMFLADHPSA